MVLPSQCNIQTAADINAQSLNLSCPFGLVLPSNNFIKQLGIFIQLEWTTNMKIFILHYF